MKIPALPTDKANHVAAGGLAASIAAIGAMTTGLGPVAGALAGVCTSIVVGVLKEAHDKRGHGTPEALDVVATVAGGAMVCAPLLFAGV